MGFSPNSPKPSIMIYKTKQKYNEWEFVYDPRADQMQGGSLGGGYTGQQGAPGLPTPPTSQTPTPQTTATPQQ